MLESSYLPRTLPEPLTELVELATDLRWTWRHESDALWRAMDAEAWEKTENPYVLLQNLSEERIAELAADSNFLKRLESVAARRRNYLAQLDWFTKTHGDQKLKGVAYFSMEFGLGEALPLYAGGLGILAGDYLKAASDLGAPVVAVGLLYQEGYFRQVLDASGWQLEAYPFNDPSSLPIFPVSSDSGVWLKIAVELPGRVVNCRVWRARVGRINLYLLDSNDPLNNALDRSITGKLYGGGEELRLVQEMVLGIGGWRLVAALDLPVEICHLNEGHAAFVTLERARQAMHQHGVDFWEALWLTRRGNLFTTHTPVAAGFDSYPRELMERYGPVYAAQLGLTLQEVGGLGRLVPDDPQAPFSMAVLAARTCGAINGVSRLHGTISRRIFQPLYPRWPQEEVPISHVTNGVHVPTWDSPWSDEIWSRVCGRDRWSGQLESMGEALTALSDEALWEFDARERADLVEHARNRLAYQCCQRGDAQETIAEARQVLNPLVLTLGFARRFSEYKRPNLLLHDPERLMRLLTNPQRPVQLIVAGKAHPNDEPGKRLLQQWAQFVRRSNVRASAVFLEDYDMALAQQMVQGVDVWINTPRRPWEACGTSGMKVLTNGGLNLSVLDGWWDEAYTPEVGWALGDGREHPPEQDFRDAEALYRLLEEDIVPLFYTRDAQGLPRGWLTRIRASLTELLPRFNANRMVREYIEQLYLPAASDHRRRIKHGKDLGISLVMWENQLCRHWEEIRWGDRTVQGTAEQRVVEIAVCLGGLPADGVTVQLYADGRNNSGAEVLPMQRKEELVRGTNCFRYLCNLPGERPASDYTARVIPSHPEVRTPIELNLIHWEQVN